MEKLSKNLIKQISALSKKKERDERREFLAEGDKLVSDLLPAFHCKCLVATSDFLKERNVKADMIFEVSEDELKKASLLCHPQSVLAVFEQPHHPLDYMQLSTTLSLMLDTVQDPGNLGTIIRIADWFGIRDVICSKETVDVYNPKVVQATMGALARVRVHYVDLLDCLERMDPNTPIYGTFLEGEDIYSENLSSYGIVVMGNEGNGVSDAVRRCVSRKLFIPNYPKGEETSESLNVAVATAIVCSEFRRRLDK